MTSAKTVLITGATGMVGGNVLKACLESEDINKVISLSRRSSGMVDPKLQEIVTDNFLDYSGHEARFENVDIAFFCLAVYAGKVSKQDYRIITVDYARAFAETLKGKSPDAAFCLFGAAGSDPSGKSKLMFARDKGDAENVVMEQGFPETYIFRPGYIYPVVKRKEPNFMYRISRGLYPLLKRIFPDAVVTSENLGKAIFTTGLKGGSQIIFENKDIRSIDV